MLLALQFVSMYGWQNRVKQTILDTKTVCFTCQNRLFSLAASLWFYKACNTLLFKQNSIDAFLWRILLWSGIRVSLCYWWKEKWTINICFVSLISKYRQRCPTPQKIVPRIRPSCSETNLWCTREEKPLLQHKHNISRSLVLFLFS